MKPLTRFQRSLLAPLPREEHAAIRARWEEADRREARFKEAVHAIGEHTVGCPRCLDFASRINAPAPDCPEAAQLLQVERAAAEAMQEDF